MPYQSKCHHGTSKEAASSILRSQFIINEDDRDWLGSGVYFFENNPNMAVEWCKCEGKKRGYTEYSVIESLIRVRRNAEIFDLSENENRELFFGHRDIIIEKVRSSNFSIQANRRKDFDGLTINELCKFFRYKVVRNECFCKTSKDRYYDSYSRVANCVIICVRDIECIYDNVIIEEGVLNVR